MDIKLLFHHGVDGGHLAGAAHNGCTGLGVVLEQWQVLQGHSLDVVHCHFGQELDEPF